MEGRRPTGRVDNDFRPGAAAPASRLSTLPASSRPLAQHPADTTVAVDMRVCLTSRAGQIREAASTTCNAIGWRGNSGTIAYVEAQEWRLEHLRKLLSLHKPGEGDSQSGCPHMSRGLAVEAMVQPALASCQGIKTQARPCI